jgi:diphthamide synthase (EF-2-diphthine--ammonia ligase)
MPRELAGCAFDDALLDALPQNVDPCAERGEFHTCVIAGPMFSRRIEVETGVVVERDGFVFADLLLKSGGSRGHRDDLTQSPVEGQRLLRDNVPGSTV